MFINRYIFLLTLAWSCLGFLTSPVGAQPASTIRSSASATRSSAVDNLVAEATSDPGKYPQNYFRPPLDLPFTLNANFGDVRADHFHSGLDLFTNHRTGYRVLAVAEGYVSRIKVQSGGYGNALYITHPNGYVSVYGHLQKYTGAIAEYLLAAQYAAKTFELDIYPGPGLLKVQQGEQVAFSGDSGFSGGPHLHFEIRNSRTEEIINPLLFGLPLADHTKPVIRGIYLFRLQEHNDITGLEPVGYIPAVKTGNGTYRLPSVLHTAGRMALGIIADDTHDANSSPHSVYSVKLFRDQQCIFSSALRQFGFDQTRSVNSYINYPLSKTRKVNVLTSYIEPGNTIPLYDTAALSRQTLPGLTNHSKGTLSRLSADGIFSLTPGTSARMRYEVADANGNKAELSVDLRCDQTDLTARDAADLAWVGKEEKRQADPAGGSFPVAKYNSDTTVYFDQSGRASGQTPRANSMHIPAGALFSNTCISFTAATHSGVGSYLIGNASTALKDSVLIALSCPDVSSLHSGKWILRGEGHVSQPAVEKNGRLTAWIHSFGTYILEQDITAPTIIAARPISSGQRIAFYIHDDLSGIGHYSGEIDGKWQLFGYDAKNHLLSHIFVTGTGVAKHRISLHVSDKAGNVKNLTLEI